MTSSLQGTQHAFELPITDPVLIVAVSAAIFLVAPLLMERLRLPGLIGPILAGAIVGPNALNLLDRSSTIVLLGTVGLLYLMFIAAVDIDLHEFRRNLHHSVIFGAITFLIPQVVGTVAMTAFGFALPTAILIGSMFASHTLIAYPIVTRFRIAKAPAVTATVGATIITNIAALLVLAVVVASTEGDLGTAFWLRLVIGVAVYTLALMYGLPHLARWFFRSERPTGVAAYLFVFATLFAGAWLADVAGLEGIVGAFLVGLALNRMIPEGSVLANRINFVGEAVFIPFFLLSVGMLVDVRVLLGGVRAWEVMISMTVAVVGTKAIAAWLSGRIVGYTAEERWTMFGLSVSQAAATLAAALIGLQIGLFDDAVLNGAILMIVVTVVLGPWIVEKYGRRLALAEEGRPWRPVGTPQRILVPMSNPATADALMELALAIREPDSREPIHPITVVPDEPARAQEYVAQAEQMLAHAVSYGSGVDVPVVPVTRVDRNFANGIARGAVETRSSTLVVGWDARRRGRALIFGALLDHLLDQTRQQVIVARLGSPLNTSRRIRLILPTGSDRLPGFLESVRAIKLLASRLGRPIVAHVVGGTPDLYQRHFESVGPATSLRVEAISGWDAVDEVLRAEIRPDDLVVVLSARRGAVSWHPALTRIPMTLAQLPPDNFLVVYPAELDLAPIRPGTMEPVPDALAMENVVTGLGGADFRSAILAMLDTAFGSDQRRLASLVDRLAQNEQEFTTELRPGVVVPHLRIPDLERSMIFLGTSPEGLRFPHAESPVHLVFVVLTPVEPEHEHLRQLAEVARLVSRTTQIEGLRHARTPAEVWEILSGGE